MTKFGWCAGPEGSVGDHDTCPHEIGAGDTIHTCSCSCHDMHPEREGGRIEQADEVRQHPIGSNRPTHMPSREA